MVRTREIAPYAMKKFTMRFDSTSLIPIRASYAVISLSCLIIVRSFTLLNVLMSF